MTVSRNCASLLEANTIPFRAKLILDIGKSMRKYAGVISKALLICWFGPGLQAQDVPTPTDPTKELRVVVGTSSADSVIAVPPDTSWAMSISLQSASPIVPVDPSKLAAWIKQESAANGLSAADVHPWHIVIAYDQFDGDGDNFNSGVLEEFWAGPRGQQIATSRWRQRQD
jgi:hypothetical protein